MPVKEITEGFLDPDKGLRSPPPPICHRKALEEFKQENNLIWLTFKMSLWLLSGEWIIREKNKNKETIEEAGLLIQQRSMYCELGQ